MHLHTLLHPLEIAALAAAPPDPRAACAVFDILRATTTFTHALQSGAAEIRPLRTVEEARAWHAAHPRWLLAGERHGAPLPGFDLGNSPAEYTPAAVAGRHIVSTTTNGTAALCAAHHHAPVTLAASLLNLAAVARALLALRPAPATILLVCAGSGTKSALEDTLAAGALAHLLLPATTDLSDSTRTALALHRQLGHDLPAALAQSRNGHALQNAGRTPDVTFAARLSTHTAIGEMRLGSLLPRPSA